MRLARVSHGGRIHLARIESGHVVLIAEESSHPAADVLRESLAAGLDLATAAGPQVQKGDVRVLAPVANPSKFLCIGLNYADHAEEADLDLPEVPTLFAKTPNTIIASGEPIVADPELSDSVDYEVELAFVMGRRARRVTKVDAERYILGYTVCNDVSARDAQFEDGQWIRGKSFDTFAPLGPVIVSPDALDVGDCRLTTRVDGELVQSGSTADQVFPPPELVAYISRFMTLEPGDVVATGTPAGVGFARTPPRYLAPGDEVAVTVAGIGTLTNPVVARAAGG